MTMSFDVGGIKLIVLTFRDGISMEDKELVTACLGIVSGSVMETSNVNWDSVITTLEKAFGMVVKQEADPVRRILRLQVDMAKSAREHKDRCDVLQRELDKVLELFSARTRGETRH